MAQMRQQEQGQRQLSPRRSSRVGDSLHQCRVEAFAARVQQQAQNELYHHDVKRRVRVQYTTPSLSIIAGGGELNARREPRAAARLVGE